MDEEHQLTHQESLGIIQSMIDKAKDAYHETGFSAIMWGSVIAICALVRLSEIHFGYRLPFDIYLLTIVAVVPQVFLTARERRQKKVKRYDDTYMHYIWLGFGICVFLMILIVNSVFSMVDADPVNTGNAAGHRGGHGFQEFIAPLFLLLYGLPTFITGAACKFRPMLFGGVFCWICCIVTVYSSIKVDLILTAASAIAAWLIPGILMEREYRRYKKEQAALHV